MNNIKNWTNKINPILIIIILGFILRIVFLFFFGEAFWARPNVFVNNDTMAWGSSIENLIKHGTYSVDTNNPYGYFGRLPGYSFFMGIFYLLAGQNWERAFPLIAWTQILLDCINIFFIYNIVKNLFKITHLSLIVAFIYACYPFIIVWTPVAYSETTSVFFLLGGFFFLSKGIKNKYLIWSAVFWGVGSLFRPQLLFLMPAASFFLYLQEKKINIRFLKQVILFGFVFIISYSPWPIRNYINHKKIILTQDLRGFSNWNEDVISFMQYIYSVKPEWEPQFSQIIQKKPVDYPFLSPVPTSDSIQFQKAVWLSQNCGSGFSSWKGYWNKNFNLSLSCDQEIKLLYDDLRSKQIKNKPFEYYVKIPLLNLKKALFKQQLVNSKNKIQLLANLLFNYRTLMILLGSLGCILMFCKRDGHRAFAVFFLSYFLFTYLALCAGTLPQMRNIEMRYFLHADILLLIPAGFAIYYFYMLIKPNFLILYGKIFK
jgi:hypothetical protein